MFLLPVLLIQVATQPAPRREVDDPGVIATGQRVTPAGLQSVFEGRVCGVRFGSTPGELWVAVPGKAYRLAWRDNRVIASHSFDGRPGVQGVVIDPIARRALISAVGRLPAVTDRSVRVGKPPARANAVAHLLAYSEDGTAARSNGTGDNAVVAMSSPALGDNMAGAPAVARRANSSGRRVAVVPLPANDALAVLDAGDGAIIRTIMLGVLPVAAVISEDGAIAYVTSFGGPKPKPGDRRATECCYPRAEPVRVDRRGLAMPGSVSRVDLASGLVTAVIPVGLHPAALIWDEKRARLFVANGNSDAVSVIDTRKNAVVSTVDITPFRERKTGLAPTALALAQDGASLYVALGGVNAVAVFDLPGGDWRVRGPQLRGLIPTGWYPSSLDVSVDGRTLVAGTLFGVGSGTGETSGSPGMRSRYVFAIRGSVNVITVPSNAELLAYTTSVAQNNGLTLRSAPAMATRVPRRDVAARPIPERPGEPSRIDHVVYIIRENRTFDQVLGDIRKGASDPSLVMYGRDVTPNAHALAEQFVLLDHFFASGGNSADGHQWLTQANETDYPMWPLYFGRSYPSEGNDPLAYSSGGFLWEGAQARGRSVSVFGEYAPAASDSIPAVRARLLAQYRDSLPHKPGFFRTLLKGRYNTHSEIPSLDRVLVREYPGWTQEVPDVVKADVFLDHLRDWKERKTMPNLVMVVLPSDHTVGMTPGWCVPRACIADNDLALGRMVEGLTHSSFWKSMAIFAVEDDAQNGVDHIDGHRTVALVASPYARRGVVDSVFYNQPSMVKTIELILGLPALSMFDLVATDMRASFIAPDERPDMTPFRATEPRQSIYETNQRVGAIRGVHAAERRNATLASMRMRFDEPDAAPSDQLNRILWHDARGWTTRYPAVKRSLFLPLAIDVDDSDRVKNDQGDRSEQTGSGASRGTRSSHPR
jgi:YVTN family beta-propeller protein